MQKILASLISAGFVTLAIAEGVTVQLSSDSSSYHHTHANKFLQQTMGSAYNFTVSGSGMSGAFLMGSGNNTVYLTPFLNNDFISVAAKNCSNCGNRNYDSTNSQWIVPSTTVLNATQVYGASTGFINVTGSIAQDSICIKNAPQSPCVGNSTLTSFFLTQSVTPQAFS